MSSPPSMRRRHCERHSHGSPPPSFSTVGYPDYDGTQFVARWRERRPDANDVPIVIVSGRTDRREIASLLGAAYVCGKPFEVDELVGEVERAVLN